jgi:hypothetical protein
MRTCAALNPLLGAGGEQLEPAGRARRPPDAAVQVQDVRLRVESDAAEAGNGDGMRGIPRHPLI